MAHISKCKHGIGMAMCDECYPKIKLQQGWEEGYDKLNKQHRWHKEIHAWADGAEVEVKFFDGTEWTSNWMKDSCPDWHEEDRQFRIKPQPKPDFYLYAYKMMTNQGLKIQFWDSKTYNNETYIGKIKLEQDDE